MTNNLINNTKKRLDYLDLTKAIAILCMVWLHIGTKYKTTDLCIHVFHMPVFFVISGFLFKSGRSFLDFFKRKISTLLIPYFFWGIVFYVFWVVFFYLLNISDSVVSLYAFLNSLLYDNAELSPYGCVQWFFTTMFFANIFFYFIVKLSNKNNRIIGLLSFLFGVIGALLPFLPFRLPLGIDISFMAVFFMGVGYFIRNKNIKWMILLLFLVITERCFVLNKYCIWNMRVMDYGIVVFYMVGCSTLSVIVICSCKFICSKIKKTWLKPLLFIGKNSIWFLIFNNFYINILRLVFAFIHINIPKWCLLLWVIVLLIPTIVFGNKYLGWSIGSKSQKA